MSKSYNVECVEEGVYMKTKSVFGWLMGNEVWEWEIW